MTPRALLRLAGDLLEDARLRPGPPKARGAALLIRQALETQVRVVLAASARDLERASFRSQLLALHGVTEAGTARRAAYLWAALSEASHHRGLDLPPTERRLRGWMREAAELLAALQAR